jgi:hypothetical protein
MVAIMAEVVREGTRKKLAEATSVTVAVDGSGGRKFLRVRGDMPGPPYRFDAVLGLASKSYGSAGSSAVADAQDDHAKQGDEELRRIHNRFFTFNATLSLPRRKKRAHESAERGTGAAKHTPASGGKPLQFFDGRACDNFRTKVRILAADGGAAERRSLFCSATCGFFPNADFVIRDFAHAVRIATQKPMQLVSIYKDVYEELINKRHALIPDLKNSDKWKKLLAGIQTDVIKMPCLRLPGSLKVVLRHLSFAKQRMDSCADPLAKLCLMWMPIGLLLACMASDERNGKVQRERAAATLKKMTPKFVHAAGIAADWGLISMAFLRLFDCHDHDIANSCAEVEQFGATVNACFVEGGVFMRGQPPPGTGGPCGAGQEPQRFITERVRMQTETRCVFRCGSQHQIVWGPIQEQDLQELAVSTRVAAQTAVERVRAEAKGVRVDFACFSVEKIAEALEGGTSRHKTLKEKLIGSVRSLGKTFQLDSRILELEYIDSMSIVVQLFHAGRISGEGELPARGGEVRVDNRIVWSKFLAPEFLDEEFQSRVAPFTVLPPLIRIYNSVLDGECQIERDIGKTKEFLQATRSGDDVLLDDLLVLASHGGPTSSQDLAMEAAGGALMPTDFTLRCVKKWIEFHGCRYGIDLSRRKQRAQKQSATSVHSFTNVRRCVLRAAQQARKTYESGVMHNSRMSAYGVRNSFFKCPRLATKENSEVWNDGLRKFARASRNTSMRKKIGRFGRSSHPKWVSTRAQRATSHPFDTTCMRRVAYVPREGQATESVGSEQSASPDGTHSGCSADIVVMDSLERLHETTVSVEVLVTMVYLIFRGLPVTTKACVERHGGNLERLAKSDVVQHTPAKTVHVEISLAVQLKKSYPALERAVKKCCAMAGSNWMYLSKDRSASGDTRDPGRKKIERVHLDTLESFWQWIQPMRKVVNSRTAPLLWRNEMPCPL